MHRFLCKTSINNQNVAILLGLLAVYGCFLIVYDLVSMWHPESFHKSSQNRGRDRAGLTCPF